jgi:hypothetical protein
MRFLKAAVIVSVDQYYRQSYFSIVRAASSSRRSVMLAAGSQQGRDRMSEHVVMPVDSAHSIIAAVYRCALNKTPC